MLEPGAPAFVRTRPVVHVEPVTAGATIRAAPIPPRPGQDPELKPRPFQPPRRMGVLNVTPDSSPTAASS